LLKLSRPTTSKKHVVEQCEWDWDFFRKFRKLEKGIERLNFETVTLG
jgi:hypothetical protein